MIVTLVIISGVILSMLYWLVVFSLLSLQVVIAFFLLTATNDVSLETCSTCEFFNQIQTYCLIPLQMTTDTETMINKCNWWRILSQIFFCAVSLDLLFILYDHIVNGRPFKEVRAGLDVFEMCFRLYGVYFIAKFTSELKGLFHSPIVQYDKNGTPIPPTPPLKAKRSIPMNNNYGDTENYV